MGELWVFYEATGEFHAERNPIFITDQWYNEEYNPVYEKHMTRISQYYDLWAYIYNLMGH